MTSPCAARGNISATKNLLFPHSWSCEELAKNHRRTRRIFVEGSLFSIIWKGPVLEWCLWVKLVCLLLQTEGRIETMHAGRERNSPWECVKNWRRHGRSNGLPDLLWGLQREGKDTASVALFAHSKFILSLLRFQDSQKCGIFQILLELQLNYEWRWRFHIFLSTDNSFVSLFSPGLPFTSVGRVLFPYRWVNLCMNHNGSTGGSRLIRIWKILVV